MKYVSPRSYVRTVAHGVTRAWSRAVSVRDAYWFVATLALVAPACEGQHATATNANSAPKPQTPPPKTPVTETPAPKVIPVDGFEVVATFPHDKSSFTQGLVFHNGRLLESQGEYGRSSLRLVELASGKVLQTQKLPPEYFAEGIVQLKGFVYQLTWRERTGFVYTLGDLQLKSRFAYAFEGWGLTTDGAKLIVSDGTSVLRYLDPTSFKVEKTLDVKAAGKPVDQLNELEWVHGEIWANVWHTDRIARIDPSTGEVVRWLDLAGLLPIAEHPGPESVLNGIAWDAQADRLFVTGKMWPKLFEIRVKKKS